MAAWVALGDDAMVQGKGAGAALRAYRKAQKLCASTPDIAYMPQVCLRVAQYETQYISRKKALAQLAEAKQGFLVRKKRGRDGPELAGRDGGCHPPAARERMSGKHKIFTNALRNRHTEPI